MSDEEQGLLLAGIRVIRCCLSIIDLVLKARKECKKKDKKR
jgi:hypothetical protein